MGRADLQLVRLVHMERISIALDRNGSEHGLNHSLWGLGCYLYDRGVIGELTHAERAFNMSHAAYSQGWDAQDEAFAHSILRAIQQGSSPLAVRARKILGQRMPPAMPVENEVAGVPLPASVTSVVRRAA